jgi:integrase
MGRVGLTKGELRLVRYGDFDVKRRTLHVPPRARGQERQVSIDDAELLADLRRLRIDERRRLREYVLHPRPVGNLKGQPDDIVPERWNKPMEPSSIHRWFKRCVERTPGVSDLTMDGLGLAATRGGA